MQETLSGFVKFYKYQLALKENSANSITDLRYGSEEYLDYDICIGQACDEVDSMNNLLNLRKDKKNTLEYIFKIHAYYRQVRK